MHTISISRCTFLKPSFTASIAASTAVLLLVGTLAAAPVGASVEVSSAVPDLSADPSLEISDGALQLSLEQAVATSLERNLSLVVERYSQEEADYRIDQTMGIFDWTATFSLNALDETSPTASNLEAGAGETVSTLAQQRWDLGLARLIPWGGTVSVDWRNTRRDSNSLFATLNPSFRSDLDFAFRQPLMRDRGASTTKRNILIAQTNREISRDTFERQVMATIQMVELAYWNLGEAQAQLGVAEESLELAGQLHDQNRIRVEVGTMAPLELAQSEAGVATRQEEIIRAQGLVGDREDVLRQLLNLNRDDFWNVPIVPTEDAFLDPIEVDLEEAIGMALEDRPELRAKRLAIENQKIDVEFFRNQKKPRLDLVATYGFNGLGGDITERDFFTGEILRMAEGGYSDALDQITGADFEGWLVGVSFAYPIANRAAKAQSAIADVSLERGMAELNDLELRVITEVRRVARALSTAAEVIESARVTRRLEEKNYGAEQKRHENGMSTSFQVLQVQEDLTGARSRFVTAVANYRKALALFYQATGQLLKTSGVAIAGD